MKIVQIGCNDGNDHVYDYVSTNQNQLEKMVLVDPSIDALSICKQRYQHIANTEFVNVAISLEGETKLTMYHPKRNRKSKIASFNKEHVIKHGCKPENVASYDIKCIDINQLLEEHQMYVIDRLYVDTEGLDVSILQQLDYDKFDVKHLEFEYIHADGPQSRGVKLEAFLALLKEKGFKEFRKLEFNIIATK